MVVVMDLLKEWNLNLHGEQTQVCRTQIRKKLLLYTYILIPFTPHFYILISILIYTDFHIDSHPYIYLYLYLKLHPSIYLSQFSRTQLLPLGLHVARDFLAPLAKKYEISSADLWTYAGGNSWVHSELLTSIM